MQLFTLQPPVHAGCSHNDLKPASDYTEPLVINLSNGELGQARFLEQEQGHVMEKVVRG